MNVIVREFVESDREALRNTFVESRNAAFVVTLRVAMGHIY